MLLEVGDYVRTEEGYIYKLSRYEEDNNRWISSEESDWYPVYESLVTKASSNIIDLIEVGDYVNGCIVINKNEDAIQVIQLIIPFDIKEKDIKSIVTKEQFSAMEYKVESEVK